MDSSSIEVGLFTRSARGVRLIGRTGDHAVIQFVQDRIGNPGTTPRQGEVELTPLSDVLDAIIDTIEREISSRSGFVGAIREDEQILSRALDELAALLEQGTGGCGE
jgi:hypothetical protein